MPEQTDEKHFLTDEQKELLKHSGYFPPGMTDEQMEYFWAIVQRTELDPFTGDIIPTLRRRGGGDEDEEGAQATGPGRLVVIVSEMGLISIADRTGKYDGAGPIEWCGRNGEWHDVWTQEEPPSAARCSVYVKDRAYPSTFVAHYKMFAQTKWVHKISKWIPTKMWERNPAHMLGKCASAGAHRKAFPRKMAGIYVAEETGAIQAVTDVMPGASQQQLPQGPQVPSQQEIKDAQELAEQMERGQKALEAAPPGERVESITALPSAAESVEPAEVHRKYSERQVPDEAPDAADVADATEAGYVERLGDKWYLEYVIQSSKALRGKKLSQLSVDQLVMFRDQWLPAVTSKESKGTASPEQLADKKAVLAALPELLKLPYAHQAEKSHPH
jgi:phage recombination protein Bet